MTRRLISLLALLPVLSCTGALAEESLDDLLENFDDFSVDASREAATGRNWDIGGQLALLTAYSYRLDSDANPALSAYEGFSKMQTLLRLHGEMQLSSLALYAEGRAFRDWIYYRNEERFSERARDRHGSEVEWSELYVRGQVGAHVEIKSGRQLLVWGRSDNLRVLDVINPLDLREPGSSDIEELRLPVAMTRVQYQHAPWTVEATAIHEVRYHKLPARGSEFFPAGAPAIPEQRAGSEPLAERAFSVTGVFPGWDFSLHYARVWEDEPWLDLRNPMAPMLRHARLELGGISFNRVLGSWLLKGEYARVSGLRFTALPNERRRRSDLLCGVEYAGLTDTQIGVEVSVSHLHDWSDALATAPDLAERNQKLGALRVTRSMLHDRLNLIAVATLAGVNLSDNPFNRLQLSFDVRDGLTLDVGLVLYGDSDDPWFGGLDDRDRILAGLKYYF